MFASKTPRDLNHDPEPWEGQYSPEYRATDEFHSFMSVRMVRRPRPEYDHVQHNESNPLLADMREFWPVVIEDWLAALDDPWFIDGVPAEFGVVTEEHRNHAKKVLTRLAALAQS